MMLGWFVFRILSVLTALAWIGTFTVDPAISTSAVALSLFWVIWLPTMIHFQLHGDDE